MMNANRTFPVSPSSFIYPPVLPGVPVVVVSLFPGRHLYSLCPGRHLCPGVLVCNFSLSVPVVIYIPCVPVVICVPVSWSVYTFVFQLVYDEINFCVFPLFFFLVFFFFGFYLFFVFLVFFSFLFSFFLCRSFIFGSYFFKQLFFSSFLDCCHCRFAPT